MSYADWMDVVFEALTMGPLPPTPAAGGGVGNSRPTAVIDVSEPPLKQQQIALAPLDTSGTEEEQRERNTLLAAARDLQPENMTYLNKLATTESSVELLNLEKEM